MTAKQISLHIGAHKSASTTIQKNLQINAEELRANYGMEVWRIHAVDHAPIFELFHAIGNNKLSYKHADYQPALARAQAQIDLMLAETDADHIICSHEGFLGTLRLHPYGFYRNCETAMRALGSLFSNHNVSIMLIVRRQDTFLESCYKHQFKLGEDIEFDAYSRDLSPARMSWNRICQTISNNLPGAHLWVQPFETLVQRGTREMMAHILSGLTGVDVDIEALKIQDIANPGLSETSLIIALERFPELTEIAEKKALFRDLMKEYPAGQDHPKPRLLNDFSRRALLQSVQKGNRAVLQQWVPDADPALYDAKSL
jgi:hypothetical protein